MRKALLLFSGAALVLSATAGPAQYGARRLDPRLVAEAQREHPQLVQEYGGADTGPRGAYVNSIGHRVAAHATPSSASA